MNRFSENWIPYAQMQYYIGINIVSNINNTTNTGTVFYFQNKSDTNDLLVIC